jgi:predicted Zn-dependent protease
MNRSVPTAATLAALLASLTLAGCGGGGGGATTESRATEVPTPTADLLPSYYAALNPTLRWPSAKTELTVYIAPEGRSATVTDGVAQATACWTKALSSAVRFRTVPSPEGADIRIVFSATIPGSDGGQGTTAVTFTEPDGTLTGADITLKSGLTPDVALPIVLHEFGHALGLIGRTAGAPSHSTDPGDVMYPVVTASAHLTQKDVNTLAKLYATTRRATPPVDAAVTTVVID